MFATHFSHTPDDEPDGGTSGLNSAKKQDPAAEAELQAVESRTLNEYQDLLLGGKPTLSAREMAERIGTTLKEIEGYWLEMGFQLQDPDEKQFTEEDEEALIRWGTAINDSGVSWATAAALTRAQSHLADRLVLWEMEALVEDAERRLKLEDTSARVVAIHEMRKIAAGLESQMIYSWRRQMYALIERMTRDIDARAHDKSKRRFPLSRALGFVDMESYTYTSSLLGGQMVGLIEKFEYVCRTTVSAAGGRVVKMIGDSVLFIADDLEEGLLVVTDLIETLDKTEGLLPVRASMVYGDVFSRSGDVFGPPVNLAARLVDVAPTGHILTDAPTAAAISQSPLRRQYRIEDFPPQELRGFGRVSPFLVSKRDGESWEQRPAF